MSKKKKQSSKSVAAPAAKVGDDWSDMDDLDADVDTDDEEEAEDEDEDGGAEEEDDVVEGDEEEDDSDDDEGEDSDEEDEEEEDEDDSDDDEGEDSDEDDDSDEEDEEEEDEVVPAQYYTVANGFEVGGKSFIPGQKIVVQCKYCAMWNTPLAAKGGKCLCVPGAKISFPLNDSEDMEWRMQPDRYSCQRYFVPLDVKDVVSYLKNDVHAVAVLRYAMPIARAIAAAQAKFGAYVEKNEIADETADDLLGVINSFAQLFTTAEQISYVQPLLPYLAQRLRAKHKAKATGRKAAFAKGDEVMWTERKSGKEVAGFVTTVAYGKKTISLMVSGKDAEILDPAQVADQRAKNPKARGTLTMTYTLAEWLTFDPQTLSEATVYDVPEE